MKLKMKYLKVFEDFINKEDDIETIKSKKKKEIQNEDEVSSQDLPEEEPIEDEETQVDDDQKEKDDIIEEIKRYYRKNKRR